MGARSSGTRIPFSRWSRAFLRRKAPGFQPGTADGNSCGKGLGEALLAKISGYSKALNGRFKGGYITRTYGDPSNGIHAVQLELSEAIYTEEQPPFRFREHLAVKVRPVLRSLLEEMLRYA